ncbi:hypothetical protein GCM10007416_13560 [Kroppenstedtia guangzhouensis]|uniref:Uncharacterized protein n=1 Tax=Kroppenstedtia guangzhouensis TaxID=1274356 RepID=A0ABQ1GEE3_9BACL|nr:hypothetical protein GCM10007416_13560 [Kroppenstedtia guangzhouensis]
MIGGKSVWAFMHGFLLAFGLILPLGVQNVFIFNQGAVPAPILQSVACRYSGDAV